MAKAKVLNAPKREWKGLDADTGKKGMKVTARCACGRTEAKHDRRPLPPNVWIKHFQNRGWNFVHKKPVCPDCSSHNKEEKVPPELKAVPANDKQPTDSAKRVRRLVYMAIEESYIEDKGYKAGVTDETIAKECNCAENLVASVRQEFFGDAGEPLPPEVAQLRDDIALVVSTADDLSRQADAMRKNGQKLSQRLDAMVAKNGWIE